MSVSVKIKRSVIWLVLIVLSSTMLIGLGPTPKSNALDDKAKDRIYISGLAFCLYHKMAISESTDQKNDITSYWNNSGNFETVVVGFNVTSDGIMTCNEVLPLAAKSLGLNPTGDADVVKIRQELEKAILGNYDKSADGSSDTLSQYPGGINGDDFENLARNYIKTVLVDQYLDPNGGKPTTLPAISDEELAERSLMLVEACFNYTLNPPGYSSGVGPTFKNLLLQDSKTIDIDFKFADRKDLAALVDLTKANEGQGIGGTSTASQLGGDGGSGGINTDGNEDGLPDNGENYYDWWHFYAFGLDLRPNMTSSSYDLDNGRQNYSDEINSIQTCKFVEENKDKIFKYYSLNDEGVLTFDGKTSDELLNDAPEDPNLTLSEGDTQPSCEGSDAMGWLICPFIEGIYYVSDAIFTHFIIPFLIVEPVNTNEGPVYAIWGSFRTIGNILLVFGLLFIVFGQAIGGGLVDAYTAKKAMPRIFLAAILINLSIYIVAFLVDMGNILGAGIGELISSPLAATGQDELGVSGAVTVVVIIGLAASAGLVLMLMTVIRNSDKQDNKDMVKVALYTVAFLAIPAILVVLGIFFTLTIRLGLILLLTVMSPVALALFVMPATEKWAKKWLDWLIKSILVYPIMIAIFAIAGVLSSLISGDSEGLDIMSLVGVLLPILGGAIIGGKVAGSKDGGIGTRGGTALGIVFGGGVALTGLLATTDMTISDLMFGLVSIVVLFIPMALIPFSFKIAGGVMGSLVGAVAKGRGTAEKLFMGDKHNQHSRYYGIMGQAKAKQKDYFAKYKTAADRNSRGKEQSISGEGGPIAAATPKSASERMRRIAQRRRARFGVQQPIEPVIAADGTPTDEVASGGQGDENPFNRRGNNTPPTAPTAPTPPTPPNSPPPPNKPWTANNAPSSPYPRQNTPTSPVQPTQASVAQAQFGRQQAGGQNTSNDGYTTPSGLIVPDTDTVIKINDQRNKPN